MHYSPAAIIRNAKIWNIILLLAFFRTLGSNRDLKNPAVSEKKLFEESTTTALTPNLLGISTFLGFLKSGGGGEFKRCNSHVTAYISVLKFLQVSVKSITHFKIAIALYMPVLFLSTVIQLIVSIKSA